MTPVRRSRGSAPALRHLPFFEELAQHDDSALTGRWSTAGLLVMRMIDHWELAGASLVAPESVSVRSVRAAIMALPPGDAVRECLLGIVNTMQTLREVDPTPVLPRLFAYAKLLERRAEHAMAADVYECITERANEAFEGDLVMDAQMRLGFCRRTLGEFVEAERAYATAGKIAKRRGDAERVLRSRTGVAIVANQRGNLPKAEELFVAIVDEATQHGFTKLRASVLHDLASVTYKRGFPARAVRMAHEALHITEDPIDRERVFVTIGALMIVLERFTAARDALLVGDAIALTEETRSRARVGLVSLAARGGDREEFDLALANVEGRPMSAEDEANLLIESARGYQRFGALEQANALLERGRLFAESHGLNRSSFEIESMATELARLTAVTRAEAAADASAASALVDIEENLRELAAEWVQ